jgi:predicted Zn-dependent protease
MPQAFLSLILTSSVAFGISQTSKFEAMYERAFQAFDSAKYNEALSALDAIDAEQPDLAESLNLRGAVYMRQGKYDRAEVALRKALSLEPKFWNARFNLAEIPFLKKDWPEARNRFVALVADENQREMQAETAQLVQYKILLTFVLQGKENMADWILNKFEEAKDSPAQYFAKAAIAYQHGNGKEANELVAAADKRFSPSLNKLYAESFYEVGWVQKPAGEGRPALQITSKAEREEHLKADAQANFEKAERAFQQRNFLEALSFLNLAEAGLPNDPRIDNLHGEILLEQKKYEEAETEFRKAFSADPKFREAQYNLAQVPFKKGDYEQARDRFEALFSETPGDNTNQASQLIKYKVYLTLLLEGKDDQAQQLMDQFKFTGDTPALYYAQAAWEFKHGRREQGEEWIRSAYKIYSPALNLVFGDSFYDLGWLNKEAENNQATTSALAQANASPKGPPPTMRLGPADNIRPSSPVDASGPPGLAIPAGSPIAAVAIATDAASPASVVSNASPATSVVNNAPVAAETSPFVPTASTASAVTASVTPATSVSSSLEARPSVALVAATPAISVSKPVAASGQATQLSPEQEQTTFAEIAARFSRPGSLLIVALLLGTALLLVGWVVQHGWRNLAVAHLGQPAPLFGVGSFSEEEAPAEGDLHRASNLVSTGPPKLSINLKATEPVPLVAVLSSGAIEACGATPGVADRQDTLPTEFEEEPTPAIPSIAAVATKITEPIVTPVVEPPAPEVASISEEAPIEPPMAPPQGEEAVTEEPASAISSITAVATEITEPSVPSVVEPPVPEVASISEEMPIEPPMAPPQGEEVVTEKLATIIPSIAAVATKITEPSVPPVAEAPVLEIASIFEEAPIEPPIAPPEVEEVLPEKSEAAVAAFSAPSSAPAPAAPTSFEPPSSPQPITPSEESLIFEPAKTPAEIEEAVSASIQGRLPSAEEPVGQGQPIPELSTALSPEPVLPEPRRPEPESGPKLIAPTGPVTALIGGHSPAQPSFESVLLKMISTQPTPLQPTITPMITPESTMTPAGAPGFRPSAPTMSVQLPASGMHTTVQVTFSLEIASMRLTPAFKTSGLQLKPTSKVVSMRFAPSQDLQPPMNLQVTFEVGRIDLSNGSIGTVRLSPSLQQTPAIRNSSAFAISGSEFVSGSGGAPVQLTPHQQDQASVHLTAEFQIGGIEFTPLFEISTILLNATSRRVLIQLPGPGPVEGAPIFEIENVQLGPGNELGLIQVAVGEPGGGSSPVQHGWNFTIGDHGQEHRVPVG